MQKSPGMEDRLFDDRISMAKRYVEKELRDYVSSRYRKQKEISIERISHQ